MLIYDLNANPLNSNEMGFPTHRVLPHHLIRALHRDESRWWTFGCLAGPSSVRRLGSFSKTPGFGLSRALIIVIISGLLIFSSDPIRYLYNSGYRDTDDDCSCWRLSLNYTIHRKVALSNSSGMAAKLVGAISLLLWISIPFGGIWISFV